MTTTDSKSTIDKGIKGNARIHYRALLIGINYIGTDAELRGCINDVVHYKHFLQQEYPISDNDIHILTEANTAQGNQPTRANILRQLQWLVSDLPSGPCKLFLQYSGHGAYVRDRSGDEDDGRDETIVPLDYQRSDVIVDDQLRHILIDPLPAQVDLLCLFDCCHSGTVLDLRYNYKLNHYRKQWTIDTDKQYPKSKGKAVVFSGCRDRQTSADAYINKVAQGAMTFALLQGVKDLRKKKKPVTYKKLMNRLTKILKEDRFEQNPQLSSGGFLDLNASVF